MLPDYSQVNKINMEKIKYCESSMDISKLMVQENTFLFKKVIHQISAFLKERNFQKIK